MHTNKFTVFGSSGFIGSNLVRYLQSFDKEVLTPSRKEIHECKNLGHAFYCIGVTADFRTKPFETVDAHVCVLKQILKNTSFESFTYLSSTRVYAGLVSSKEDQSLHVNPGCIEDIYNISKILGEAVCLASQKKRVKVVRLSNVYGDDFQSENFLTAIIKEAVRNGRVTVKTGLDSEKDYISIDDVTKVLPLIVAKGKHKIYNVASGRNTMHRQILTVIQDRLKCDVVIKKKSPTIKYPKIEIGRIKKEFGYQYRSLVEDLPILLLNYKDKYGQ